MELLVAIALGIGATLLLSGVLRLLLSPLAIWFELVAWIRRRRGEPVPRERLSVVVPCFDEERVLEACVGSLVAAVPSDAEIVLVDDGSTDRTWELAAALAERHASVRAVRRANGGKGAALNTGIAASSGELVLLTDADGLFTRATIRELMRGMADDRVGAVCGDDRSLHVDSVQTRFLALISHVGTGLMRRALATLRILPIVSGNVGLFRRSVLEELGGLREDTLGEDLELTWRVQLAGHRVVLRPRAIVYAESPTTLHDLWRQRVRWARGLLQAIVLHRRSIGAVRRGVFAVALAPLAVAAIATPVLQLAVLPLAAALAAAGSTEVLPTTALGWLLWSSLVVGAMLVLVAVALDRAWLDLRFAWTLPLWPCFSVWASVVMLRAMRLELRGAPQRWEKVARQGGSVRAEARTAAISAAGAAR